MKGKSWLRRMLMALVFILAINVGAVGTTTIAAAKKATVKAGQTFWSGSCKYKVTSVKAKKKTGTAALIDARTTVKSVSVPKTVKTGGYRLTVNEIGANAFKDCKSLKKVTTNTEIKKIGKNAFKNCKKLKKIRIESKKLKSVGKDALKGTPTSVVVEVSDAIPAMVSASYKSDLGLPVYTPHTHKYTWRGIGMATCTANGEEVGTCSCGDVQTRVVPALGHNMVEQEGTPATCLEAGLSSYSVCSRCEYRTQQTVIPALGHDMVEHEGTPATCLEAGLSGYEACSRCGYRTAQTEIPALGHNMQLHPGTPATCLETGTGEHMECTRCGLAEDAEVLPALGHELKLCEPNAPTCTEEGLGEHMECTRCDYRTETEVLPPLGHMFGEWVPTVAATCVTPGVETRTCEVCHESETRASALAEHVFSASHTTDFEPTCASEGQKSRHCTNPACTAVMDIQKIPALAHDWSSWEISKTSGSACTGGAEVRSCRSCGAQESRALQAAGHKFGEWVEKFPARCDFNGLQVRTCTVCGFQENRLVEALKHNLVSDGTKPAGCTNWTEHHSHCTICGQQFFSVGDRPLGHEWKQVTTEANCLRAGESHEVCTRCGAERNRVQIPRTDHKYTIVRTEATCTRNGMEFERCETCGKEKNQRTVAQKLAHSWTDNGVVQAATCTKDAQVSKLCSACGATMTVEAKGTAKGHRMIDVPAQDVACDETGYCAHRLCTECGYTEGKRYVKGAAHVWVPSEDRDMGCDGILHFRKCTKCGKEESCGMTAGSGHSLDENNRCTKCGHRFGDEARAVWVVWYTADTSRSYGFGGSGSVKGEGMINETAKLSATAPDAKPGFQFDGWYLNGSFYSSSRTITNGIEDAGKSFEARYSAVETSAADDISIDLTTPAQAAAPEISPAEGDLLIIE